MPLEEFQIDQFPIGQTQDGDACFLKMKYTPGRQAAVDVELCNADPVIYTEGNRRTKARKYAEQRGWRTMMQALACDTQQCVEDFLFENEDVYTNYTQIPDYIHPDGTKIKFDLKACSNHSVLLRDHFIPMSLISGINMLVDRFNGAILTRGAAAQANVTSLVEAVKGAIDTLDRHAILGAHYRIR